MSRADALWESYLTRAGGRAMFNRDAAYSYQLNMLRDMVHHLAMVLEDEQLPPEQADRILRCVLYGAPTVADAEQRIRMHDEMTDLVSSRGPEMTLRFEDLGLPTSPVRLTPDEAAEFVRGGTINLKDLLDRETEEGIGDG